MSAPPPRREIDKSRWSALSPLLDELLDLDDPAARQARLAALRAQDPELALDLEELLARDAAMAQAPVLDSPVLLAQESLQAGQHLGPYTLEREIGQGGMGTVWLARRTDGRFEGQVAIKFLTAGLLGRSDSGRFAREGQILGRLAHPHIARLLDAGVARDGGTPYLVLEYIDGQPIDRYCEEHRLDVTARVTLFLDVLSAVAHAHNRLILHRDLKPSNILVNQAGEVKLLDFGIAKLLGDATQAERGAAATELTQQAGRAFTPQYAAPEQVQGGDVTTATDVYALGVLLYLLLSGQHPTSGAAADESPLARMKAVLEVEPRRLSDQARSTDPKRTRELRGDLDTIVARALKKSASERYANAEALAADLRRWLAHEPIQARPDSASYRIAKFVRRHRLGVAAGTAASLAILGGVAVALWKAQEAHEQRVQAEGLIEFMLGDLRKKLEPVGRLDVLDAVGEKALGYYAEQDLSRADADALGRRARALHLMGEIAEKRGRLDEAERMFLQASASTAELLQRDARNTQRIFDHAQSVYWEGYNAWRRGHASAAERHFQSYLAHALTLTQLEPKRLEWRIEQASAEMNLGVLLLDSGRNAEALEAFQASVRTWTPMTSEDPAKYFELANAHGWVANALERTGQYMAAAAALQAKSAAAAQVPDAQENQAVQRLLANTQQEFSRLKLALGEIDAAIAAGASAVSGFASLVEKDPSNTDYQTQHALAWIERADALLAGHRQAQVADELATMAPRVEQLLGADAGNLYRQVQLRGRWLLLRARIAGAPSAEAHIQRALTGLLQDVEDRITQGAKLSAEQLRIVSAVRLQVAAALDRQGERSAAAAHRQHARDALHTLSEKGDMPATVLLGQALWSLNQTQEVSALVEKLEASAYRHPMYGELRRLVSTAPPRANPTH